MHKISIAVLLLACVSCANAAAPAKGAKPVRAPLLEKLTCRTGPNDEQARLIVEAVKGRVMEFAFYSRLGTRVCSIHARRGDSFTQWQDDDANAGSSVVKLLSGSAQVEYRPGRMLLKFADVDRMKFCGMYGELNASIEVQNKKPECTLAGVFDGAGDGATAAEDKAPAAAGK